MTDPKKKARAMAQLEASRSPKNSEWMSPRAVGGLALFVAAAFPFASLAAARIQGEMGSGLNFTSRMVAVLRDGVGFWPALILTAAIGGFAAWQFLGDKALNWLHLAATLALGTGALSLLASAAAPGAGGDLGALLVPDSGSLLGRIVAGLLGLICAGAALYEAFPALGIEIPEQPRTKFRVANADRTEEGSAKIATPAPQPPDSSEKAAAGSAEIRPIQASKQTARNDDSSEEIEAEAQGAGARAEADPEGDQLAAGADLAAGGALGAAGLSGGLSAGHSVVLPAGAGPAGLEAAGLEEGKPEVADRDQVRPFGASGTQEAPASTTVDATVVEADSAAGSDDVEWGEVAPLAGKAVAGDAATSEGTASEGTASEGTAAVVEAEYGEEEAKDDEEAEYEDEDEAESEDEDLDAEYEEEDDDEEAVAEGEGEEESEVEDDEDAEYEDEAESEDEDPDAEYEDEEDDEEAVAEGEGEEESEVEDDEEAEYEDEAESEDEDPDAECEEEDAEADEEIVATTTEAAVEDVESAESMADEGASAEAEADPEPVAAVEPEAPVEGEAVAAEAEDALQDDAEQESAAVPAADVAPADADADAEEEAWQEVELEVPEVPEDAGAETAVDVAAELAAGVVAEAPEDRTLSLGDTLSETLVEAGPEPVEPKVELAGEGPALETEEIAEEVATEPQAGKGKSRGKQRGRGSKSKRAPKEEPIAPLEATASEASEADDELLQTGLFDAEATVETEPEVVLEPQERPVAATAKPEPEPVGAAPAAELTLEDDRERLVYESGCLFLDEGRVAVSMLQKRYSMDFKAATAILDELQERGLIGPYLGGKRRDILLTREEWQAQALNRS